MGRYNIRAVTEMKREDSFAARLGTIYYDKNRETYFRIDKFSEYDNEYTCKEVELGANGQIVAEHSNRYLGRHDVECWVFRDNTEEAKKAASAPQLSNIVLSNRNGRGR